MFSRIFSYGVLLVRYKNAPSMAGNFLSTKLNWNFGHLVRMVCVREFGVGVCCLMLKERDQLMIPCKPV